MFWIGRLFRKGLFIIVFNTAVKIQKTFGGSAEIINLKFID